MNWIQKIPFFRILLPLLVGIVFQYYKPIDQIWSITVAFIGILIMLFSFFINQKKRYHYRWLFGVGCYLVLFCIGSTTTMLQQWKNTFPFTEAHYVYHARVTETPIEKDNTYQLSLNLDDYDRKIVGYIPKDPYSSAIDVGDQITFFARIDSFRPMGNVYHFNYNKYLYNRGFAGIVFIPADRWEVSSNNEFSIEIVASKYREKILSLYHSFNLTQQEFAILAGLTIGYKSDLSEDLIHSFRTTGTAHILAVSGLHVGILYFILTSTFIRLRSQILKQLVVLSLLWFYILVVGLPPSAIRAGVMLSLFSIGQVLENRTYSLNSIFLAAFFILLFSPFYLFDVGFQLSFAAVIAICLFMPFLSQWKKSNNRYVCFIYNTLALSLAAQIGIMPLCLYHFGYFPVYFLLANLLIVPLLSFIFYDVLLLIATTILGLLIPSAVYHLTYIPILLYRYLVKWIIGVVDFFSTLPYSTIDHLRISLFTLFILFLLILAFWVYLQKKSSRAIVVILLCCVVLLANNLYIKQKTRNTFVFFNNMEHTSYQYQLGYSSKYYPCVEKNQILKLNNTNIYLLRDNNWHHKKGAITRPQIDYLLLETRDIVSLTVLYHIFDIKNIIFGNSISRKTVNRLVLECEKLRIPYYDLYTKGDLTINF